MKIKLDKADQMFSKYIRARDKVCQRCGSNKGLQASHYYGRGKESTRFDPHNVDCLCFGCHQYWGSTDREAYRTFKLRQLGEKGFQVLTIRANTYQKKDRELAYLQAKALLEGLSE